ncbi:MAG: serine O-acetyltransferase [Neomegalonema sp.]|nr:serine O-acetyltransferase [Neomegalonema sp.]
MPHSAPFPKAPQPRPAALDPVWDRIREEARLMAEAEPMLASMAHTVILNQRRFEDALAYRIAQKLGCEELSNLSLRTLIFETYRIAPALGAAARADVVAVYERDAACRSYLQPVLFFKGFLGLQAYRIAHHLWRAGRLDLASALQVRISEVFGMDIHPGARIGKGILIDHATGVVIGETAVIEDDVSMLHGVTLGGTGKEAGDRHPKIGRGVLIGANASILGNIRVGHCSRVGAGSVVLHDVADCKTVAGVPARVVGDAGCDHPSQSMDHQVDEDGDCGCPDR